MASIYFYYNELLRQSADQAVANRKDNYEARQGHPDKEEDDSQQQERQSMEKLRERSNPAEKGNAKENQDEDSTSFTKRADTEASFAVLQPRMNRLVYLQPSAASNLDVLARSLGPKL